MGDAIRDDDDDDFSMIPGGKSRLSNLFSGQQQLDGNTVNQTLTYVPPKQPKKSDGQQSHNTSENLKLIHAIAVFTYKLEEGKYTSQGKLGLAILGDKEKFSYKLLLYKGKQQTVTLATINSNFKFNVESNNYGIFPDDRGQLWSIMFNSEIELINFIKQLTLAKVGSVGKSFSSLIVQDLMPGEGPVADNGNSIIISYIGWLYRNFGFGEIFANSDKEGKKVVIELGKSNLPKGWSDGLKGVKLGSKRFIIMPVSFSSDFITLPDFITPHDTLMFEIWVKKVRRSVSPSKNQNEKKPDIPPRSHSVSEKNEDIRSRGASLSEQLIQSPRKDNAEIISRMAKIGGTNLLGQTLPAVQTSSESEPEKETKPIKPRSRKHSSASPKHSAEKKESEVYYQLALSTSNSSSSSSQMTYANSTPPPYVSNQVSPADSIPYLHTQGYLTHVPHLIPPSLMPPAHPSLMENHFPFLVSQNTELNVNLSKVSDKIDTAIKKIDAIQLSQNSRNTQYQGSFMDNKVIIQNVERIVQENMELKTEIESKNSKIHELNEKIYGIFQENQGLFKESHNIFGQKDETMMSTSVLFQNQIQNLEKEKAKLSYEFNESISKTSELESRLEDLQKRLQNLQEKLNESESKKLAYDAEIKSKDNLVKELQEMVEKVTREKDILIVELKKKHQNLEDIENTNTKLVLEMKQLSEGENLAQEEIKSLKRDLKAALEYKTQFDLLKENTLQLKSKYEMKINHLLSELKSEKGKPSSDFSTEIRKAMNKLYKFLQNEVDQNKNYSGKEVLNTCLDVIKRATFTMIGKERALSEKSVGPNSEKRPSIGDSVINKNETTSKEPDVSHSTNNNNAEKIQSGDTSSTPKVPTPTSFSEKIEESNTSTVVESTTVSVTENSAEKLVEANKEKVTESVQAKPPEILEPPISVKPASPTLAQGDCAGEATEVKEQPIKPPQPIAEKPVPIVDRWRPQPSPPPVFDDDDEESDEDDWLK